MKKELPFSGEKDQYTWEQIGVQKGSEAAMQQIIQCLMQNLGMTEQGAKELMRVNSEEPVNSTIP